MQHPQVGMCGIKYCQSALTGTLTSTFNMAGTTTSGAAKGTEDLNSSL